MYLDQHKVDHYSKRLTSLKFKYVLKMYYRFDDTIFLFSNFDVKQ